jgi:hypothetical protein
MNHESLAPEIKVNPKADIIKYNIMINLFVEKIIKNIDKSIIILPIMTLFFLPKTSATTPVGISKNKTVIEETAKIICKEKNIIAIFLGKKSMKNANKILKKSKTPFYNTIKEFALSLK